MTITRPASAIKPEKTLYEGRFKMQSSHYDTLKQKLASQLGPLNLTDEQKDQLVKELDDYANLIIDTYLSHKDRT